MLVHHVLAEVFCFTYVHAGSLISCSKVEKLKKCMNNMQEVMDKACWVLNWACACAKACTHKKHDSMKHSLLLCHLLAISSLALTVLSGYVALPVGRTGGNSPSQRDTQTSWHMGMCQNRGT